MKVLMSLSLHNGGVYIQKHLDDMWKSFAPEAINLTDDNGWMLHCYPGSQSRSLDVLIKARAAQVRIDAVLADGTTLINVDTSDMGCKATVIYNSHKDLSPTGKCLVAWRPHIKMPLGMNLCEVTPVALNGLSIVEQKATGTVEHVYSTTGVLPAHVVPSTPLYKQAPDNGQALAKATPAELMRKYADQLNSDTLVSAAPSVAPSKDAAQANTGYEHKLRLRPNLARVYANDKYQRAIKGTLVIDGKQIDSFNQLSEFTQDAPHEVVMMVDAYDVDRAFNVSAHDPALAHAFKKMLACGNRGHKDYEQDLIDILSSVEQALFHHQERMLNGKVSSEE